jgi:hypothetical protein
MGTRPRSKNKGKIEWSKRKPPASCGYCLCTRFPEFTCRTYLAPAPLGMMKSPRLASCVAA